MKFDQYISEAVGSNTLSKNVSAVETPHVISDATVRKAYNEIQAAINNSPLITPGYAVYAPTDRRNVPRWRRRSRGSVTFFIIDVAAGNAELTKIHKELAAVKNKHVDFNEEQALERVWEKCVAGNVDTFETNLTGLGKVLEIGTAEIQKNHQGKGLMFSLYKWIVLNKLPLTSNNQSPGAIKLWAKLYDDPKITVAGHTGKHIIELTKENGVLYYKRPVNLDRHETDVTSIVAY